MRAGACGGLRVLATNAGCAFPGVPRRRVCMPSERLVASRAPEKRQRRPRGRLLAPTRRAKAPGMIEAESTLGAPLAIWVKTPVPAAVSTICWSSTELPCWLGEWCPRGANSNKGTCYLVHFKNSRSLIYIRLTTPDASEPPPRIWRDPSGIYTAAHLYRGQSAACNQNPTAHDHAQKDETLLIHISQSTL